MVAHTFLRMVPATMAIVVVFLAACATGTAPASRPTTAVRAASGDAVGDVGPAPAPSLWLVRDAIADAHLSELRIASWPEHRDAVERFYTRRDFTPAWTRKGRPTQAALDVIHLLEHADAVGLAAEDYDAGRWADRVSRLRAANAADVDLARFDLALTVGAVRYATDLHHGRIDPRAFRFEHDGAEARVETFDPAPVVEDLIAAAKIDTVVASLSPPDPEYQRLVEALGRYRELARGDAETAPLFEADDVIRPGDTYVELPRLAELLDRLGDLSTEGPIDRSATLYQGAIVEAVANFQRRHGLEPDGKIGKETLKQLSTPLAHRVRQIELALEQRRWQQQRSWAWLADGAGAESGRRIVVNVPEFRLRALDGSGRVAFTTNVVVGRADRTETPVFTELMRTVVFRPGWYVPASITSREIVAEMEKDPFHLEKEGYEIVGGDGSDPSLVATLTDLRSGARRLRQKPGPRNALGPVKFLFPNEWNVYLHGTPSVEGFARAKRDLSHGCMRVADPIGLAEWVLRDQPDWDRERILQAVSGPPDEVAVTLDAPIPVHVVYQTVVAGEDGEIFFYDDLYGHDARLEKALDRRHLDGGERTTRLGSN